jgi:cation transport ATPase
MRLSRPESRVPPSTSHGLGDRAPLALPAAAERNCLKFQSKGATIGFLGDGINDAPDLKVADIGLSVEGATGVAQAAADMILLASDL